VSVLTPNYSFILPGVNDPSDMDLWGGYLNSNLSAQDTLIKTISDQANLASPAINPQTSDYTVLVGDKNKLITMDATGGNRTVTLLAAATAGSGFRVSVKKIDSTDNTVTVDGNISETIDGELSVIYTDQWDTQTYICNGTAWFIIDDYTQEETANRGCYAYQVAGTSVPSVTWTDISYDTEYYDDFSWHTGSTFTVDFDGFVEVDAQLGWTSNNPNGEAFMRVLKNGTPVASVRLGFSGDLSAPATDQGLCQKIRVAPADVIKTQAWRNGGGGTTEPSLTRCVVTKFRTI